MDLVKPVWLSFKKEKVLLLLTMGDFWIYSNRKSQWKSMVWKARP